MSDSSLPNNRVPTTAVELGERLRQMYRDSDKGEAVLMIHLFGIMYADQINDPSIRIPAVITASGIKESYAVEVNKGVKLAKYVCLRTPGII